MAAILKLTKIEVKGNLLMMIINNEIFSFDITTISKSLSNASALVKSYFVVSASGYGIHWPDIDEDISIPALLKSYQG